jgi:hypothetical protein
MCQIHASIFRPLCYAKDQFSLILPFSFFTYLKSKEMRKELLTRTVKPDEFRIFLFVDKVDVKIIII